MTSWHTFSFEADVDKHKGDIGETVGFWRARQRWHNLPIEAVNAMQAILVKAEGDLAAIGDAFAKSKGQGGG